MRKWIVLLVAIATLALTVLASLFLVGMRTKSPLVQDRVRRFNRAVTNRRVLRSAGSPGVQTGVMCHVGRVSGREYRTPVGPFALGDQFVIALPYGAKTDWVRNVIAAGSATLVHEGRTVPVHMPEVVPTSEVMADLPVSQQRVLRVFGVDQCLRVRPVSADIT
jgi:deazaflavin-dependent oxidoreductase (nitroreductase family)